VVKIIVSGDDFVDSYWGGIGEAEAANEAIFVTPLENFRV
jgi:hypothetical protein